MTIPYSFVDLDFEEGNSIEFLPNGIFSYEKRWELIQNAEKCIHIVTFSFMRDDTTRRLATLLKEKIKQNVKVKIICDDIVNKSTFVGGILKDLQRNGVEIIRYNSLWDGWGINLNQKNKIKRILLNAKLKIKQHFHEKYMVIDNEHLILGGINWGDKYAFGGIKPKAWRDTDIYIKGPIVEKVHLQFLMDFEKQKKWEEVKSRNLKYDEFSSNYINETEEIIKNKYSDLLISDNTPKGNIKMKYLAHKPYDSKELILTDTFLKLIKNAQKRIYWGCHGIRPPKIYCDYLSEAVKRGVDVLLITNSGKSARTLMLRGIMGWMYFECTKFYKHLLDNGIKIYEWQKPGAFHSKNLLIDFDISSVGSYNIAIGSTFHHSESNIIVKDRNFNEEVYRQFLIDLKDCNEITTDNFKFPKENAYNRQINERYKMIDENLLPESIKKDLSNNNYKKLFEKL